MSKRPRVAFVVQRCGEHVNGGAEAACLSVAKHLSDLWEIDILTTCALDYRTWQDYFAPGEERVGAVTIRRFHTEPRNVAAFDRRSKRLRARLATAPLAEQLAWMRAQGPESADLLAYVESENATYDAFFFFTYLYATTYFGLSAVREKAFLVPFAHDEWPIHLTMWDAFFGEPRGVLCSAPEERDFLARRFPHVSLRGEIVGVGIDSPQDIDPERFRSKYGLARPFALYVGRIDEAKNVPALLRYFLRLQREARPDLDLVLLGRPHVRIPKHSHLHALGFVDERDKWDALAACQFLINPSAFESLSLVLFEAWHTGRPVLVNAAAEVMVGHCRRSGGGLWYSSYAEFARDVSRLSLPAASALGAAGERYARENYRWPLVREQYRRLVENLIER